MFSPRKVCESYSLLIHQLCLSDLQKSDLWKTTEFRSEKYLKSSTVSHYLV